MKTERKLKLLLVQQSAELSSEIEEILRASELDLHSLDSVAAQHVICGNSTKHHPDVCLVESCGRQTPDLMMTLRATLNCPIIVLTNDSGSEVLNAIHCGAADCLLLNQLTAARLEEAICASLEHSHTMLIQDNYERWYLSLVENSPDVIFTQDLRGEITSINRVIERLLGYTQDEVVGMNISELLAPECAEAVWTTLTGMFESRRQSTLEVALLSKDWQRVPLRMTAHLIYRYGLPIGIQGVMRVQGVTVSLRAAV